MSVPPCRAGKKISRLMREGAATGLPRSRGEFFRTDKDETVVAACAIGFAAMAAAGSRKREEIPIRPLIKALDTVKLRHPVDGYDDSAFATVIDLHDRLRWPATKIADWLEGQGL